jgi:Ca-activated chloride channel family protein
VHKHKVLIIITDGEDHQGNAIEAAKAANQDGVIIYTIGLGSESGVPIPTSHGNGNVIYKKDSKGNLVLTKLNSAILEQIAMEGKGKFFHAGTDLDFSRIMSEIAKMEKKDFGTKSLTTYEEQYQIFLLMAIIFILLEFFLPERSRKKEVWKGRF